MEKGEKNSLPPQVLNKQASQALGHNAPKAAGNKHVFIAVMGITGSGKSSFIKSATGYPSIVVGDSLTGCTQVATSFPIKIGDTIVNLIDTPGFDDTNRYDIEVLEEISTYLATHYKLRGRICGLVYLHPISDNRMRGTARLNIEMFQELCGTDALRNVVLASTMWDLVPKEVGEAREAELASNPEFWGKMIEHGSRIERHDRSKESALAIIRSLIDNQPATLHIQDELVNKGLNLDDTDCGKALQREFAAQKAELEKKLETLEKDHEMSATMATAKFNKLTDEMEKIETARQKLKEDMEKKITDRETEFHRRVAQVRSDTDWWKRAGMIALGIGAVIATGGIAMAAAAPAAAATSVAMAAPVGVVGTGAAFLGELGAAAAGLFTAVEGSAAVAAVGSAAGATAAGLLAAIEGSAAVAAVGSAAGAAAGGAAIEMSAAYLLPLLALL